LAKSGPTRPTKKSWELETLVGRLSQAPFGFTLER
jgi:hypothetical protein